MRTIARNALKLGLLILGLAVASELVLQVAARIVPDRGGQWRAGARYRVLAMGDSHTWGSGVGRADAYPGQLQRALDARERGVYSVINRGLPGMSTTQLRNRFAVMLSRYRPDAVVIWCGANNLWNHTGRDRTTTPALLWLDGWLSRLRTYRLVRVWLHDWPLEKVARAGAGDEVWDVDNLDRVRAREQRFSIRHDGVLEQIVHERGPDDGASLFDRTLEDLDAIAAIARAGGVELVFITYPVDEDFFATTNRAIREAALRNGLPVVESPAALARIPPDERAWEWALHPDARLYGEVVADLAPVLVAPGGSARRASEGCDDVLVPVGPGFGAAGPHVARREVLANPLWPDHEVSVYTPIGVAVPAPLVILAHANGNPDPASYAELIRHIVSRGNAVVYPSHQIESKRHADRYAALWAGVQAAVEAHGDRFDLGRIGLVGHSYGAGALFDVAHRALVDAGWGADGAFLLSLAPWYALGVEDRDPDDLPAHLKALFVVFEDDKITDHRMAIAQRDSLGDRIETDLLLLRSDRHAGCVLPARHSVPQSAGLGGRDDAFDERVVFRLADALAAYAFQGAPDAGRMALGRGDPTQTSLGFWTDGTPLRPLVWVAHPQPVRPESDYMFPKGAEEEWRRYGEPAHGSSAAQAD